MPEQIKDITILQILVGAFLVFYAFYVRGSKRG